MKLLSFYSLWKSKSVEGRGRRGIKNTWLAFQSLHTDLSILSALRYPKIIFFSIGEVQVHNDKSFIRIDFHIGLHGFTVIKHYTDRSVIIPKMQMQMSEVLDGAGDNDQDLCGYSILLLINRIYVSPHRATINMAGM